MIPAFFRERLAFMKAVQRQLRRVNASQSDHNLLTGFGVNLRPVSLQRVQNHSCPRPGKFLLIVHPLADLLGFLGYLTAVGRIAKEMVGDGYWDQDEDRNDRLAQQFEHSPLGSSG